MKTVELVSKGQGYYNVCMEQNYNSDIHGYQIADKNLITIKSINNNELLDFEVYADTQEIREMLREEKGIIIGGITK